MPEYLYRREDGSTFTIRQKFSDDALTVDPETGQKVTRIVQPTGIIFKGSGFYVNDSKGASKTNLTPKTNGDSDTKPTDAKSETKSEAKAEKSSDSGSKSTETKSEKKSDTKAS